jgi:predicted Kef-type K+ transport protein
VSGILFQAFVYLCAAVVAVPIARRLGLGSVLGYLIAGIAIGPVIGLVGTETREIQHFAELGVVMMLFLVGLELEPRVLWEMRDRLLGLGGLQVGGTAALIAGGALLLGLEWRVAVAVGLIFSLSSTAIVLQTLNEKGLTKTVEAGVDFGVLFGDFATVLGLTLAVILVKGLVLLGLARLFRLKTADAWLFALGLALAGEFGFVLLSFGAQTSVIPGGIGPTLSLIVALSMLLTPALFILYDRLILPRLAAPQAKEADEIGERGAVVIAGIGRFGQIVNRLLVASDVRTVVLDHAATQIDILRQVGVKSYFGDASRPELLHAAGIEDARVFIVAIDDRDRAFLARAKAHGETLREQMEADRLELHDRTERGWTPPPKGYTQELND